MLAIFGVGQVLWAFLMFFLWVIWICLAIAVFIDIFRSPDLSGPQKALWVVVVLLLPYIGVFVYLLIRGGKMYASAVERADAEDRAFRERMRQRDESLNNRDAAEELSRLVDLKDRGVISEEEFERLKTKEVG